MSCWLNWHSHHHIDASWILTLGKNLEAISLHSSITLPNIYILGQKHDGEVQIPKPPRHLHIFPIDSAEEKSEYFQLDVEQVRDPSRQIGRMTNWQPIEKFRLKINVNLTTFYLFFFSVREGVKVEKKKKVR